MCRKLNKIQSKAFNYNLEIMESQKYDSLPAKPLLEEDEAFFVGQKQPEDKNDTCVTGLPVPYSVNTGKADPNGSVSVENPSKEWSTGLFSCCNVGSDEWISRDWEICCIGWTAPCVLYGGISEKVDSSHSFRNSCLRYFGLCTLGELLVNFNAFAPLMSFRKRTEIRKKYGIKGHLTKLSETTGCFSASEAGDDSCDCVLHFLCHKCALCQEARELHRQTVKATPSIAMAAPVSQDMSK